ncbi:MAG: FAD-dependent oxidoreductase [Patescibacteria group bacterium]|jgi:thioredoxin reductase (NADPH)|nr:FAD-dependent oxidoreductase [Patescibacteria group bacterium]
MSLDNSYDLVIIGAGPTALTTAIYTTREDIDTLLIEKGAVGGMASVTDLIDNYPGFSKGISGLELSEELAKQAERFGAKIEYDEIKTLTDEGRVKLLQGVSEQYRAKAVLIATGTDYKKIGVPGEVEYLSRGVHYCATCDGAFYRDRPIAVVGGGNSAIQETLFLTRYASSIDLLVRSTIKASDVLQKELQKYIDNGKVKVHLGTNIVRIMGENNLVNKIEINQNGATSILNIDGVFVFVGLFPNTAFLKGIVELDERNFIKTNQDLETNIPGVFAAGDVRSGATMQIASASGEGATVALKIRQYLERNK